nr:MAG TPA: replisome organizer [Caudoviricetes sp.]
MADVKWIKITLDMFDNRKIKCIRNLPEGNNIVLIWVMLLTMAGKCNSGGMIFLTENIPYTTKTLADELGFDESVVQLALNALEKFDMITRDKDLLLIPGWGEYQNVEGMEKIREQNRIRKQKQRERENKLLENSKSKDVSRDMSRDVTQQNKNKESEIEIEYNNRISKEILCPFTEDKIIKKWNELEKYGIKTLRGLKPGTQRRDSLKARLQQYSLEEVLEAIDKIKNSDYLQGKVNNWQITFDWFVRPNNFPKVLDGNYDNRQHNAGPAKKTVFDDWRDA